MGRRHDRGVAVDSVEDTLEEMDRASVDRTHVHAPHAAGYGSPQGKEPLMRTIAGQSRLNIFGSTSITSSASLAILEPLGMAISTRT